MLRRAHQRFHPVIGSPWFRVTGTLVAVFLFVHNVDLGSALNDFSHLAPGWTVLAVALAAISVAASIGEWGVLLRGTGHALDWSFLGGWYLKGLFVNQVLPAGVGSDAMRALRLGRLTGHGPMVASLVASRMAGTLGMAAWALAAAVFLRDILHIPLFTGFVCFAFFMLVAWSLALLAERVRIRIPEHRTLSHAAGRVLHPFTATFHDYLGRPGILAMSIVMGTLGWGVNLFSMQAFALALGTSIPWSDFAVALPLALLATFVPISANGIGVREGVLVGLLVKTLHVGLGEATALSLFVDLQMVPFAILGGMVFLAEHGRLQHPIWVVRQLAPPWTRERALPAPPAE